MSGCVPGETALETRKVLGDVAGERRRQDDRWGQQSHPDGTGHASWGMEAETAKELAQQAVETNTLTWRHILDEEVTEAFAESDLHLLREELIQVAAVASAWVEDIDRRLRP